MSCISNQNKPDWKAYTLGELDAAHRREAEAHAAACAGCREELASIRLTLDALSSLCEEEMPRRIAFVSDKVFEPRWWQAFLRPSFAGACVIALAILAHGFMRQTKAVDAAEIQARIDAAVAPYAQQTANVLSEYEIIQRQNALMYVNNTRMVRQ